MKLIRLNNDNNNNAVTVSEPITVTVETAPAEKKTRNKRAKKTAPAVETVQAVDATPVEPVEPLTTGETADVHNIVSPTNAKTYNLNKLFYDNCIIKEMELNLKIQSPDAVPMIDSSYCFNKELTDQILLYLAEPNHDCLWIAGPAGTGKTTSVLQVAARLGIPVQQITCSNKCEALDLIGHTTLVNGSLQFVYGPLTTALKNGEILLLNELDTMSASDLSALNDVLEGKPLTIVQNNGEVIKPHPNFRLIATANTFGNGDEYGMYSGTRILNQAFLDRFRFVRADAPSASDVTRLINKVYGERLGKDNVTNLGKMYEEVQTIIKTGMENGVVQLSAPFSIRTVLKIAGLMASKVLSIQQCVDTAIGARLNKDESKYLTQLANDIWGHEKSQEKEMGAVAKVTL